jgi:AraC-like DNA-binding protein
MQRVGVLACLPPVLRELGADSAAVLAEVGLPADALDRPDAWVPVQSGLGALQIAADRSHCPHIGVLVGQRFQLSQIALLGELMLNSDSIGDALRSYVVHQRLYSQAFTPYLQAYGRTVECGFAFYRSTSRGLAVAYDLLLAALVSGIRLLRTPDWTPSEVHLPRSAPADPAPYRAHFRCKLMFDSDHASVVLRSEDLDRAIAGADPARFRALEQEAIDRLDSNLLPLLHRSLRMMLVTGEPKAAALAQAFAMHERTLARRLQARGTSFRAILDEVRYEAARALLVDTGLTITSIATSLGYAEVAPFSKAFHRWSQMSPSDWRAANQRQAPRE